MKKIFAIFLSLLILTGCSSTHESSYQQISPREAQTIMETEEDIIILDVRTPEEFAAGHIPGAVNIPVETIGSASIPALPRKDQKILIYCRSGNRSKAASQRLADQGYTQILEFGGIRSWKGPVTTE